MRETEARRIVRETRRNVVLTIVDQLADLEGKVAAKLDGPVEIPLPGSAMADHWARLRDELGHGVANFTIGGQRLWRKSERTVCAGPSMPGVQVAGREGMVDTLDALLDRYTPGEPNTNDALEEFAGDLSAILTLRHHRKNVPTEGVDDPLAFAADAVEAAALVGTIEEATAAVLEEYRKQVYTVSDDDLAAIAAKAAELAELDERRAVLVAERDELVRAAVAAKGSLRKVGAAAGLSHQAVKFIAGGRGDRGRKADREPVEDF